MVDDAAGLALHRLHHHGRRAVAEEHDQVAEAVRPLALLGSGGRVAAPVEVLELRLRPGHEAGVDLRPHEEHGLGQAGADVGVGELQAVEEAAALLADVEAGHVAQAELRLQQGAAAGEEVVGGHGGEDHEVHLVLRHPRVLEGLAGGGDAEVGGGRPLVHEVAGLDAAALPDPGVARVHEPRQHVVGDPVGRDLRSAPHDDGTRHDVTSGQPGQRQGNLAEGDCIACSRRPWSPTSRMLKADDFAPDFKVGSTTLHQLLRDRRAVVFFFPKAFTPG